MMIAGEVVISLISNHNNGPRPRAIGCCYGNPCKHTRSHVMDPRAESDWLTAGGEGQGSTICDNYFMVLKDAPESEEYRKNN